MSTIQFLGIVFADCLLLLGVAGLMLQSEVVQFFIVASCEKLRYRMFGMNIIFSPFHPNSITYIRGVLALVAMAECFKGELRLAIILGIVSAFGDALDGMVARACGLGTEWGKFLDPLFDKITYLPLLTAFAMKGWLAVSLVATFFILELTGQFLVRPILVKFGLSMAANKFGKWKANDAFFLVVYVFILQENPTMPNWGNMILLGGIILAVLSIVFKAITVKQFKQVCIESFVSLRRISKI
jgi:phosphatidylglycerophosphate synthase